MAIFDCTECGGKVSSEATTCPHCGSPVQAMIKKIAARRQPIRTKTTTRNQGPTKQKHGVLLVLSDVRAWLVLIIIFCFFAWSTNLFGPKSSPRAVAARSPIERQFSAWDGSHIALTKRIKEQLNDPGSYDHGKTVHVEKDGTLNIMVSFRATNGFGALVLQQVIAEASATGDGDDVHILSQK